MSRKKNPMPDDESNVRELLPKRRDDEQLRLMLYREGSNVVLALNERLGSIHIPIADAKRLGSNMVKIASAASPDEPPSAIRPPGEYATTISLGVTAQKEAVIVFGEKVDRFDMPTKLAREIGTALVEIADRLEKFPSESS